MRNYEEIKQDVADEYGNPTGDRMQELVRELRDHTDPDATRLLLIIDGDVSRYHGDLTGALRNYEKSLAAALDAHSQAAAARAEGRMGAVLGERGDISESLRLLERSLDRYTAIGSQQNVASTLNSIGLVLGASGAYLDALDRFDQALRIHDEDGDDAGRARVLANMGGAYRRLGRHTDAVELYTTALESAARCGDRSMEALIRGNIGNVYYDQQEFDAALERYEQTLALYRSLDSATGVHRLLICKGLALMALERYDAAREVVAELEAQLPQQGNLRMLLMDISARLLLHDGNLDEAQRIQESALELARSMGLRTSEAEAHKGLASISRERGDLEGYIHHTEEMRRIAEELSGTTVQTQIAIAEAQKQLQAERQERERERTILYSTLPKHAADRMIVGESVNDHYENAAVLFTDIAGFTTHTSSMHPSETTKLLEEIFSTFDAICEEHGVIKVKTIGDSYLCFAHSDIGEQISDIGPEERIAAVALGIQNAEFYWPLADPPEGYPEGSLERLAFRIGIHSGPVTAGVIGTQRLQYDIWGDTVNVASRMESTGEAGRIQCSEAFASVLSPSPSHPRERGTTPRHPDGGEADEGPQTNTEPSNYRTVERGTIEVKGKGSMTTYWLEAGC